MKVSPSKYYFITNSNQDLKITGNKTIIKSSSLKQMIDFKIHHKLNFDGYIVDICIKAG